MEQLVLRSDSNNKMTIRASDVIVQQIDCKNKMDDDLFLKSDEQKDEIKMKSEPVAQRPHFKIDWRQLTYYQKPASCFSQIFNKFNISSTFSEHTNAKSDEDQLRVGAPKRILNSLDGCFRSGELSAILGPSGAGKSTFLATLFGAKQDNAYGQTKVTWFDQQLNNNKRRAIRIAVLPQHDHLLHHLTVYETLLFASKIKNATRPKTGKNFHRQNVKRVAKMLKLSDCLDTRCGKLSGGQYKRVSIGQELLSEPDVIILDEPTSGLDAMTCLATVQTLKSIVTKHPISIILTIHQPDNDVFNLFDHVYVIAQGGLAIYEGTPQNILPTMAKVNLKAPSANYNPARFIVENAFVVESGLMQELPVVDHNKTNELEDEYSNSEDDEEEDGDEKVGEAKLGQNYIKRSVLSLTDAISGKETISKKDKKPLLNIGIQTLDGKLITSTQLAKNMDKFQQSERWNLLKRLNEIQKAHYQKMELDLNQDDICSSDGRQTSLTEQGQGEELCHHQSFDEARDEKLSAKSDYSSLGWTASDKTRAVDVASGCSYQESSRLGKATSLAHIPESNPLLNKKQIGSLQMVNRNQASDRESVLSEEAGFVVNFPELSSDSNTTTTTTTTSSSNTASRCLRLRRNFDKSLSAKHNCSKQKDYPIWYHAFLLTHRTWLSIVRDPIFFGIQACMHITIPIILAVIFGSSQEDGCPRIGNFDLVEFAYSDSANIIQGAVSSIRKSIGNIGIMFFEMFVLSFSINCITALVFPSDMHVLLKEYRNGWYSLRSYFFGRTLADLPVPILLHSLGMAILYFLTGQPHSIGRFSAIIVIVILASLVAQSIGLTIGALLMKSSQSAVLAAAGIVAPFFALSGFIVRIHTLPLIARFAAKFSYFYHLLNGFIILRYGFGRCQCRAEDFDQNEVHQIPSNLHTLASMWIGTYSDEYANSSIMSAKGNKTNVDPNIDVVDKMMNAFKMANSYGHQIQTCDDVLPYAMLDFNLRDQDIYLSFVVLIIMVIISRTITFGAIFYKIRSYA